MHGVDAFRESFEGLVAEDDAVGAAAEGVNDQVAFARAEQHHRARAGLQGAQFAQDAKTFERTFMQLRADDGDVRSALFQ
jgi:hypothetical protein